MKAIKLGCVIVALVAVTASATDGVITWGVDMPQTVWDVADIGANPFGNAYINVEVTGDNQGLGGYNSDIRLSKISGANQGVVDIPLSIGWGTTAVKNERGYKSPISGAARGSLIDPAIVGGPNMSTLPSTGTPGGPAGTDPQGWYIQVGTSYLSWSSPLRYDDDEGDWLGNTQWGVGRAERKSVLQGNPALGYLTNHVRFRMLDLFNDAGPGQYKLEVLPNNASVLMAGINLDEPQAGGVLQTLSSDNVLGGSMVFTIVPEPATLLLLAGAGAFIRRRRHA